MRLRIRAAVAAAAAAGVVAALGVSTPAASQDGLFEYPARADVPWIDEDDDDEPDPDFITLPDSRGHIRINPDDQFPWDPPVEPFLAHSHEVFDDDDVSCAATSTDNPLISLTCAIVPVEPDQDGASDYWTVLISAANGYPAGLTGDEIDIVFSVDDEGVVTQNLEVRVDDTPPEVSEHRWARGTYVLPQANTLEWNFDDDEGSGINRLDPMYTLSYRWAKQATFTDLDDEDEALDDDGGERTFPMHRNNGLSTYCSVIFATDRVGNVTFTGVDISLDNADADLVEEVRGTHCTSVAGDDYRFTPANGFTRGYGTNFAYHTVTWSQAVGATLGMTDVTAKTVAVRARTCGNCGSYEVWLDGKRLGGTPLAGAEGFKTSFFHATAESKGDLVIKSTSAKWTGIDAVWATGPCVGDVNCPAGLGLDSSGDASGLDPDDVANALVAPRPGEVSLAERFAKIRQRQAEASAKAAK